jgi:two-component system chemotaxis response regulator CheB
MTRVLVVEDSAVVRQLLVGVLASDPDIAVVGTARDGEEALEAVQRLKPDIVTMDIHMPKLNGFDATRRIMESRPTPIVIVSGSSAVGEVAMTFDAMEAGALAVVPRPKGVGHPEHQETARALAQTVKLMSEVKVVRRWPRSRRAASAARLMLNEAPAEVRVVAIGASTGGPLALQKILAGLGDRFPVPLVIVQHISAGFSEGLAQWLARSAGFPVCIPRHGDFMSPGNAYVAPDGSHMGVDSRGRIILSKDPPEHGLRPSVSYLFRSVAQVYARHAVGVLLTGMGRDGAGELKLLKEKSCVTIAQDKESCVVHGMPGEAMRLGAATHVLPPEKICEALRLLALQK